MNHPIASTLVMTAASFLVGALFGTSAEDDTVSAGKIGILFVAVVFIGAACIVIFD